MRVAAAAASCPMQLQYQGVDIDLGAPFKRATMAELVPMPFDRLIRTLFRSLEAHGSIFDIPQKKFFRTPDGFDFGIRFHGLRTATALGPAAGPHAQMAQNIVMAWLTGSRVIELKTVQINDELDIPRPCIDMPNLGFNVEWSQELKVDQSLLEYAKGSMMIDMLAHCGAIDLADGDTDICFDMSVGYDLAGIRSEKVTRFIDQMRDASAVIDRLREEIPDEYSHLRDIPFRTALSESVTLSTFHGCPPDEVERIGEYLIDDLGVRTIIKLNPTLLGPERLRGLLNDHLGYDDLVVPDTAFSDDMQFDQAIGIITRLRDRAAGKGLGFGAKFTNTCIVENHRDVFASAEKVMYMSGDPLHVLSMNLVTDFRERFGNTIQLSFSAGIKADNFHEAVCLGLTPVTTCTDLLKKGGYMRSSKYFVQLRKAMKAAGARDIESLIMAKAGRAIGLVDEVLDSVPTEQRGQLEAALERQQQDGAWQPRTAFDEVFGPGQEATTHYQALLARCTLENSLAYRRFLNTTDTYSKARLDKVPPKPGTTLWMFDCLTCDICVPVCPNNANFAYDLDTAEVPVVKLLRSESSWHRMESESVAANKKHQIANFADFCNECGNCDTFCPDLGGPYILKPRFFGSLSEWRHYDALDGFYVERGDGARTGPEHGLGDAIWGRFEGRCYQATVLGAQRYRFDHEGLALEVDLDAGETRPVNDETIAEGTVIDLTYLHLLNVMRRAILRDPSHYLGV